MPVRRGRVGAGPWLVLLGVASLLITLVTVHTTTKLVGIIVVGQVSVIVWLLSGKATPTCRITLTATALGFTSWLLLGRDVAPHLLELGLGGLCHAATYITLLIWFVRSLQPGREPVITGFARQMRQTMPAAVVHYTRQVTIAWCAFFAFQLILSAVLLMAAPSSVWSSFVTLLNLPLIIAMMLAEFGVRLVRFRHDTRTGLFATLAGLRRVRSVPGR